MAKPTTPWERLRAERLRLGMNQCAFAAVGGVQKQAQLKYEKGARKPDAAYLAAIAAAGADVAFILTGERTTTITSVVAAPSALDLAHQVETGITTLLSDLSISPLLRLRMANHFQAMTALCAARIFEVSAAEEQVRTAAVRH